MRRASRRQFLAAASGSLAAVLAGCQDGDTGQTASPTPTATETPVPTATTPGPASYTERARAFLELVDEGSYERAHARFSPEAAEAVPLDRLQTSWEAQEAQLGDLQAIGTVRRDEHEGSPAATTRLSYEDGQLRAIVIFGQDAIDGFLLRPVNAEWSPPEYADESSFTERTLSLSATDGCSLGATLTAPEGADDEPVPGVVIVHGQGPMDRNGTYGPNRVYEDLAWGLSSRGIAVLRYDKRSMACDVDMAQASIHDVITEDALEAVDRLREVDGVAADEVVVAGHSTGGTLTPLIARRDGNLAGIAMLAALYRPAHEAILDQNEFMIERDGTVTDEEEAALEDVRTLTERIRTLDVPDDETLYLGGDEYWGSLQEYDHEATARDVDAAQLYLQGGRDWQVTVEDDFEAWKTALEDEPSVSFERYEDLNHLFMPGSGTPSQSEYYQENHVDERVVDDLASFVDRARSTTDDDGTTE